MKGNLSQFEARVNDVIRNTYNSFKDDVAQAIGYVPKQKEANTRANNKSILVETERKEDNLQGNLVEPEQEETR